MVYGKANAGMSMDSSLKGSMMNNRDAANSDHLDVHAQAAEARAEEAEARAMEAEARAAEAEARLSEATDQQTVETEALRGSGDRFPNGSGAGPYTIDGFGEGNGAGPVT